MFGVLIIVTFIEKHGMGEGRRRYLLCQQNPSEKVGFEHRAKYGESGPCRNERETRWREKEQQVQRA